MSLQVQGVSFGYGRTRVLDAIDLELNPGEVLGLVGPNGAGKSTLIKLLTRVLAPDAGMVTLNGRELRRFSRLELARQLAVVPQAGDVPEAFTALELVLMGRTPHLGFMARETRRDFEIVERTMHAADVWRFQEPRRRDPVGRRAAAGAVGAGAGATAALFVAGRADEPPRPQVPNRDFEPRQARGCVTGLGVLAVLHDLNLAARACDRVLVLNVGRVVAAGKPEEVFTEKLLTEVYETDAHVFPQPGSRLPVVLPRL